MSPELAYLAYAVLGVVAGILGGMLGMGGGVVTVPCLLYIYHSLGYSQPYIVHMAIATSLGAMIFTTAAATWAHQKRKAVLWSVLKKMIPGVVVGSVLGAILAIWLSGIFLEMLFGFFLCALAVRFYFQKPSEKEGQKLPGTPLLSLLCGCVGIISNLLGIGGGSLTVPMLTYFRIPDKKAIGTSAAMTLCTSILGTISYAVFAWGLEPVPDTLGLIHLPSCLIIGVVTFFAAPYGAKLSHEISPQKVRRIFAFVLALTGLSLII